ncbi:MAG: SDR family oxidoreductase [Candidatus Binataceae bacterium]
MAAPAMFDLSGKLAIVTGGNGGIGRAIALGLAEAGASVAILARDEEKNRAVLRELAAFGVRALALKLDVGDREQLRPALEQVEHELGALDILVNNAGIAVMGGVLNLSPADWDRVIETNLSACFMLSRLAAKSMIKRRHGKIVNIASEYSFFGAAMVPAYSAAKGGLLQLTRSTAIELAAYNIQVNAIVPGWIETAMTASIKSTPLSDEIIMRTPAGRFGTPEECAGAAIFLASRASDFITGSTVFVDGGYRIR